VAGPAQGSEVIPVKPKLRVSLVWLDVVGDVACCAIAALTHRMMLSVVGAQLLPALSLIEAVGLIPSLVVLAMYVLAVFSPTLARLYLMDAAAM